MPNLVRIENWQSALDRFFSEHRGDAFHYGSWDCCLFACGAIESMTGVDLAVEFRDRYCSRPEALRAVKERIGIGSVGAIVENITAAHGMRSIAPPAAQRGDVVLIGRGRDSSLGIVALNGCEVVVAAADGLARIPLAQAKLAWRV